MALTKSTTNNQLTNNNMEGMPLTTKTTTASCIIERHAINKRQSHLGVLAISPRPKGSLLTVVHTDTQQRTGTHSKTKTHTQHSTQTHIAKHRHTQTHKDTKSKHSRAHTHG